jgi:hypothetical protein
MCPREPPCKPLAILCRLVLQIHVVSDLVHQDVSKVKPMELIQVGPAERVGVEKHATLPVMPVKGGRTDPTLQLLHRSG